MEYDVYVQTLHKYPYRQQMMTGALKAFGYPMENVKFFYGPDAEHYGDSKGRSQTATVMLASVADDFDHYKAMLKDDMRGAGESLHLTAQVWGHLRMLREIIETGATTIVIHDDTLPGLHCHQMEEVLHVLEDAGGFKLWLYQWFGYKLKEHKRPRAKQSFVKGIYKGIRGIGDKIIIYSPAGAAWMLNAIFEHLNTYNGNSTVEYVFERYLSCEMSHGFYSTAGYLNPARDLFPICYLFHGDEDSNIMWYNTEPNEEGKHFRFKVPQGETNRKIDIDWHYYDTVLPKLKSFYKEHYTNDR